ncbi:hypothetical protein [Isoptericola nanjingensis]|uniref:hypothetical protein n=1 Tax=Isoptericola nanjingensis TaxID=903413 RepID=UPI003D20F7D6
MFNESWPWKRDLAESADRLEEARFGLALRLDQVHDRDDAYEEETEAVYQVERDVMSGAFATRRLIGMPLKVTKGARATKATVTRFPLRDGATAPDAWDALGYLEMYETATPNTAMISANELCNLFVHSLIFRLAWTQEGLSWPDYRSLSEEDPRSEATPMELAGLLVATDRSSSAHLTFVDLLEVVRVFRVLANDEVAQVTRFRDRRGRFHSNAT